MSTMDHPASPRPKRRAPRAFARFEFQIAWAYLRARRREGGISTMSWISLIGIALAVFALIATLAVRSGFRSEFTNTILGANAHVSLYPAAYRDADGVLINSFAEDPSVTERLLALEEVTRAAPLIRGQGLISGPSRSGFAEIYGLRLADLKSLPMVVNPKRGIGEIARFDEGLAIGADLARKLGVTLGDQVKITSPEGVKTAFGTAPRVKSYQISYIFSVGRYDIDSARVYLPFAEAQSFFNREGRVDEFEIMLREPDDAEALGPRLLDVAALPDALAWSWFDASGAFLNALRMEDNIMFIILSILVLLATMNIVSGLIMLVKNKGRDIGILRTMGLTEGAVLRIFFLCGAGIGVAGTAIGTVLGCLFALNIEVVYDFVNGLAGGGVWDPSVRFLPDVPSKLRLVDVLKAVSLSLSLSFGITYFPARRAARLNPVEALRYE